MAQQEQSLSTDRAVMVIGHNHWGVGRTEAEAKDVWKRQSHRRLSDGYTVLTADPRVEFVSVDFMGVVSWKWREGAEHPEGQLPPEPKQKDVAPRG